MEQRHTKEHLVSWMKKTLTGKQLENFLKLVDGAYDRGTEKALVSACMRAEVK